jgi:hypothetical protein
MTSADTRFQAFIATVETSFKVDEEFRETLRQALVKSGFLVAKATTKSAPIPVPKVKRLTGYSVYCKEQYAILQKKGIKGNHGTEIGKAWKALSSAEQKVYKDQATSTNPPAVKTHHRTSGWQLFIRSKKEEMNLARKEGKYDTWSDVMVDLGKEWTADESLRKKFNSVAKGEPVEDEPVEDEPVEDEPVEDEPI